MYNSVGVSSVTGICLCVNTVTVIPLIPFRGSEVQEPKGYATLDVTIVVHYLAVAKKNLSCREKMLVQL